MDGKKRVAVIWRGDPAMEPRKPDAPLRYPAVLDALAEVNFTVQPLSFSEDESSHVQDTLEGSDAVLVWVDPISEGKDRSVLDDLLRAVASRGTLVLTHPDTILKMGTKDVLYDTRELSWNLDVDRYDDFDAFVGRFPSKLADGTPRVLKQHRGNGGIGVWKVEVAPGSTDRNVVRIQHAAPRDGSTEDVAFVDFLERMAPYFEGSGHLIDQAFVTRVSEGMVRAYLVKSEVVGFARQYSDRGDADRPPVAPDRVFGIPAAKSMLDASDEDYVDLRRKLELEWVPGLQRLLRVSDEELPVLWDADFLFGPSAHNGMDTYVLCEVNVSCVSPFPPSAPSQLADALARQLQST